MSQRSYAIDHGATVDNLAKELGLNASISAHRELAAEALDICEAGYSHGLDGWYSDGEFASDADWVYGIGDRITQLEVILGQFGICTDDGPVFEVYREAHSLGLANYDQLDLAELDDNPEEMFARNEDSLDEGVSSIEG